MPVRIEIYLSFERFPIWLSALDLVFVRHVWIMGWKSRQDLELGLEKAWFGPHLGNCHI
jgi:hypothetical protein